MPFFFLTFSQVEYLSEIIGLVWADAFNVTFTVFWICFLLTALWVIAATLFELITNNFLSVRDFSVTPKRFTNYVGFYALHGLLLLCVILQSLRLINYLWREAVWQFGHYQKYGHVWLSRGEHVEFPDIFIISHDHRNELRVEDEQRYRTFFTKEYAVALTNGMHYDTFMNTCSSAQRAAMAEKSAAYFAKAQGPMHILYSRTPSANNLTKKTPFVVFTPGNTPVVIQPKQLFWQTLDNRLAEVILASRALGLGTGWGWDFLVPATADFVGIVQLYLVLMTVVVVVSIVVTFMFKFSATDRLDQVNQLFHRFGTELVRVPEFRLRNKNYNQVDPVAHILHDAPNTRPDWYTDLRNLDNYTMTDTQASLYNSTTLPEDHSCFTSLGEYVNQKKITWEPIALGYDSLVAGRPANYFDFETPGFVEEVPEGLVWNLHQRRWQNVADYSEADETMFWELQSSRELVLTRLLDNNLFGVLVGDAGRRFSKWLVRNTSEDGARGVAVYCTTAARNGLRSLAKFTEGRMDTFSRWEYKQYLRFEEKYYYANSLYGATSQIAHLPKTLPKKAKQLFEPENATVAGEIAALNAWVGGAPRRLTYIRELPPLEDFIYLFKKYCSWAYEGAQEDLGTMYNFTKRWAVRAAVYVATEAQFDWKARLGPKLVGPKANSRDEFLHNTFAEALGAVNTLRKDTVPAIKGVVLEEVTNRLRLEKLNMAIENLRFWSEFTVGYRTTIYKVVKPLRVGVNFVIKYVINEALNAIVLTYRRALRYAYRADHIRGTLPFFKFLTSHSVNKFWVYHSAIEFAWTIIPCLILVTVSIPSFALALALDENFKPQLWVKVIGNQWFWIYEYSSFDEHVVIDSVIQQGSDLKTNALRLLAPDTSITIPYNKFVRFLVTSTDVIHSWAVPAMGIKVDACPGRINSVSILPNRLGIFYGQCSEICGVNHAFMPIAVEVVA